MMNYLYAVIVVGVLVAIFILSYYLNGKVKVECDDEELCEGCKVTNCFKRKSKEE